MFDYLNLVMQCLKNSVEILFMCPQNNKKSHKYAISPIIEHHNSVEWVL